MHAPPRKQEGVDRDASDPSRTQKRGECGRSLPALRFDDRFALTDGLDDAHPRLVSERPKFPPLSFGKNVNYSGRPGKIIHNMVPVLHIYVVAAEKMLLVRMLEILRNGPLFKQQLNLKDFKSLLRYRASPLLLRSQVATR